MRPDKPSSLVTWLNERIDPATSLSEILFGLVMTLTFTLGAGAIVDDEGREGVRQMLIAVLGCNVAWGIIDGAFYLIGEVFERGQLRRLGRRIRQAGDAAMAKGLVADRLDELFDGPLDAIERSALYARVVDWVRANPATDNQVTRTDFVGALVSGLLVVVTSLPAAVPFLFVDDLHVAIRASNAILLALLFGTGWQWARYTNARPLVVGLGFVAGGIVLVLIAIPLGG